MTASSSARSPRKQSILIIQMHLRFSQKPAHFPVVLTFILQLAVAVAAWQSGFAHEGHNDAFADNAGASSLSKVYVEPEGQRAIGIETTATQSGSLTNVLRATGNVVAAENRAYDVNPQVGGIVNDVFAKQGDTVVKGQTLATIHSVDVGNILSKLLQDKTRIQSEMAKTKTQYQSQIAVQEQDLNLAKLNFQRQQELFTEGISARKDLQQTRSAFESAQVRLAASKKQLSQDLALSQRELNLTVSAVKSQLKIMGMGEDQVDQVLDSGKIVADVAIKAPVSGVVTFREITPGENIPENKKIFSIVNLQPIWVNVDVFQEQIPLIKLGQTVQLRTPSDHAIRGKISNVGSVVDPQERTLHVRIESDNPDGELKPGMFVTAEIATGQSGKGEIVPNSALVKIANQDVVYVAYGNYFQPVVVAVGDKTANDAEIIRGLFPGDKVVTKGALQLQAQARIRASQAQKGEKDDVPQEPVLPKSNQSSSTLIVGILIGLGMAGLIAVITMLISKRPRQGKAG